MKKIEIRAYDPKQKTSRIFWIETDEDLLMTFDRLVYSVKSPARALIRAKGRPRSEKNSCFSESDANVRSDDRVKGN